MYSIVETFIRVVCFEIGYCFSMFVLPIILHAYFGVPYIN
jgi:hypothetical protein